MKKTIADTISNKIRKGDVTMRSKLSIWIEKLGIDGGLFLLISLLFMIAGFVLYWTNNNSDLLLGGYGNYGLFSFMQSFPYLFVLAFIFLFILLIILFRRFDFSYKKPFIIFLLLILASIFILGWISTKQPIGQRFYQREGRTLRMGTLNNKNTVSGTVLNINKNSITVQTESNTLIIVKINSQTHFRFGQPKIGDQIRSVGVWKNNVFNAVGVRVFDESNPSTLGPDKIRGPGQRREKMWYR